MIINMFGCEKYAEFGKLTGNRQIKTSDNNMDYIKYRIIRKDGSIRWI